nr:hypothetical protein [uncultured Draconibacterium sp.]
MERTNAKLKTLYEEFLPKISGQVFCINKQLSEKNKATNPLLIKIDQEYINAKMKIMFFGQETNGWHMEMDGTGKFHGEIEPLLQLYERFYLKRGCYSYGGQFWNGINRFKQKLKTCELDTFGLTWNNVVKIGRCGKGTPHKEILNIQKRNFKVIEKEIEILKPDFLVFFSGPNYDHLINEMVGPTKFTTIKNFKERQLCTVETAFGVKALRTYHPNYLWRNGINKYLDAIINEMKNR